MKNKNKILMRILLVILTLTLISTLVLSSVYARYVKKYDNASNSARPAGLKFEAKFDEYINIEAGYTIDDEPGNPIGHTEARRYYDFTVKSYESEVALDIAANINFDTKMADKVRQARANRFVEGIWCDYELMLKNPTTGKYELVAARGEAKKTGFTISETGLSSAGQPMMSSISALAPAKTNVDGTTTGEAQYRLVIVIYNNTLMEKDNGEKNYFLDSNAMTVTVSATQHDPGFSGIVP